MCDPSSSLSLLLSPARSKTHPSPCATADLFQSHTLTSLGYCISGLTGLPPCNASSSLQPPWLWGHSQFWASQGHSHTCQIKPRLCSMAYHTFWDSASPMPQGTWGLLVGLQIFHALSVSVPFLRLLSMSRRCPLPQIQLPHTSLLYLSGPGAKYHRLSGTKNRLLFFHSSEG